MAFFLLYSRIVFCFALFYFKIKWHALWDLCTSPKYQCLRNSCCRCSPQVADYIMAVSEWRWEGEESWFCSGHSCQVCFPQPSVSEWFHKYFSWLEDSTGKLLFFLRLFRSGGFCVPCHPDYFLNSFKIRLFLILLNSCHHFTYVPWNIKWFSFLAKVFKFK